MVKQVIPGGRRALPTPLTQAEKDNIAATVDPRVSALEGEFETGTFVPTLYGSVTAGAPTLSGATGYYTRVGKVVTVSGGLFWSSLGGAEGEARIGNLPFTCRSGGAQRFLAAFPWYNGLDAATSVTDVFGFINGNTDYIRIVGRVNGYEGVNTILNVLSLSEAGEIYYSATYHTG